MPSASSEATPHAATAPALPAVQADAEAGAGAETEATPSPPQASPPPHGAFPAAPDDDEAWASAVMADEAEEMAARHEPPPWFDEAHDGVPPPAATPPRAHPPVQPLPVRPSTPPEVSASVVKQAVQAVDTAQDASEIIAVPVREATGTTAPPPARAAGAPPALARTAEGDFWHALVQELVARDAITALARELALQSELVAREGANWRLRVDNTTLAQSGVAAERLQTALRAAGHDAVQLAVEAGPVGDSPSRRNAIRASHRLKAAEALLLADPFVQEMMRDFGATVVAGSLKAL